MNFNYATHANSAALTRNAYVPAPVDDTDYLRTLPLQPPRRPVQLHAPGSLRAPPTGPPPSSESQQLLVSSIDGGRTMVFNVPLDTETSAFRELVRDSDGVCGVLASLSGTQLPLAGTLRQARLPNPAVLINHVGPKGAGLDHDSPKAPPAAPSPPVVHLPATEEKGEFPPDTHPTPGLFFGLSPPAAAHPEEKCSSPTNNIADPLSRQVRSCRRRATAHNALPVNGLMVHDWQAFPGELDSARDSGDDTSDSDILSLCSSSEDEDDDDGNDDDDDDDGAFDSAPPHPPAVSQPSPPLDASAYARSIARLSFLAAEEAIRKFPLPPTPVRNKPKNKGKESAKAKALRQLKAKPKPKPKPSALSLAATKDARAAARALKKLDKQAADLAALAPLQLAGVHPAAPPMDLPASISSTHLERPRIQAVSHGPLPFVDLQPEAPPIAKVRPPFTPVPLFATLPDEGHLARDMVRTIVQLRLQSRCLGGKPPHQRLASDKIHRWLAACDAAAADLGVSIDRYLLDITSLSNQLGLLNAVVTLLQTPAKHLGEIIEATHTSGRFSFACPNMPEIITDPCIDFGPPVATFQKKHQPSNQIQILNSPDLSASSGNADATIKTANRLIQIDRQATATKILISHGVIEGKPEVAACLNKMHLERESALKLHDPPCAQLQVSTSECIKELQRRSGCKDAPYDCFGWSAELLFFQNRANNPLIHQMGRLCSLLASGMSTPALSFLLASGALTGLNKIPADEQTSNMEMGLPPKLRPINKGSIILNVAFKCAVNSPSAIAAKNRLLPVQLGLGAHGGPAKMATLFRGLYKAGFAISTQDACNAFNAVNRQAIMDAVHKHWPEGVDLINDFYGPDALVLYEYTVDGAGVVDVFVSMEGTRQGCVLGSFLFDLAMLDIYSALAGKYPMFVTYALTDDLPLAIQPPPRDSDWATNWACLYDTLADFLDDYDRLANPIGIRRHPAKGKLLVPADAPLPLPGSRILALTAVAPDFLIVAGACIGTDAEVKLHALRKVDSLKTRVNAIVRLCTVNSLAALELIGQVANNALNYHLQITPPHLMVEAVIVFDKMIAEARLLVLSPPHLSPVSEGHPIRLHRANQIASLAKSAGGLGHTTALVKSPCAFLAATLSLLTDPAFDVPPGLLNDDIDAALHALAHLLGVGIHQLAAVPGVSSAIPTSTKDFELAGHLPETKLSTPRKVQGKLVVACDAAVRAALFRDNPVNLDPNDPKLPESTHLTLILTRSQAMCALSASQFLKANRVESLAFAAYMRFYLLLLPLSQPWATNSRLVGVHSECDALNVCRVTLGKVHEKVCLMDPCGNHACSCPSTAKERYVAHSRTGGVLKTHACLGGCNSWLEPESRGLLGDEFTAEQCASLAPKRMTLAGSAHTTNLLAALHLRDSAATTADRLAATVKLDHLFAQSRLNTKGLRVDVAINTPNGKEFWIDVSRVHHTPPSLAKEVTKFCSQVRKAEALASHKAINSSMRGVSSPNVAKAENEKKQKYAILTQLAERQYLRGARTILPEFLPCILSHAGELSSGCIRVVEIITNAWMAGGNTDHKRSLIQGKRLSASFRTQLRDALMFANINGFGRQLLAAGRPMSGNDHLAAINVYADAVPCWEQVPH